MNNDLISRSALKKALDWIINNPYVDLDREIMEEIDNAPTVEQEFYITGAQWDEFMKDHKRPHGKWIDGYCNKCGASSLCDGWGRDVESRFCPHCGANMKEAENE